jgi:hypothetical protein
MDMFPAKQAVGLEAVLETCRHWHEVIAGSVVAAVHDLKYADEKCAPLGTDAVPTL